MIIYQLHKTGGQWEDYFDYIIGSYLRKERAEEEKIKAEVEEKELIEQGNKCNNCQLIGHHFASIDDLLVKYPCSEAKLEETDYGIQCANYCSHWDDASFRIEEVEVEE